MNDNIEFKCCVEECKLNIQISEKQFINLIDDIGNNLLKNKYCKIYYVITMIFVLNLLDVLIVLIFG